MSEFVHAVVAPQNGFLRAALLACLLSSVACGVIGTYVVTRRISYIAAAIAHSVLGGIGAVRYLSVVYGWTWLDPMAHGAVAAAVLAALVIGLVSIYGKEREDTVIGAVWVVGMAVGVLFFFKTPGYNSDLISYLFGNILLVSRGDLVLIAVLDAVVVGVGLLFRKQLFAVCFDEEFARVRGLRVEAWYLLLLVLTALTVVLLVHVVGIVLVIALLTLPVAVAGRLAGRLGGMMALASVVAAVLTCLGLAVSYGPDLPAGATIIVLTAALYLALVAVLAVGRRLRRAQPHP